MPPVLILCGGLGTRVKDVLVNTPKVLAPIGDMCFLEYLLAYLQRQAIQQVYFALGVGAEKVITFLDNYDASTMNIQCFQESRPLGTLGAICFVLNQLPVLPNDMIVMNGDTFINLDLAALDKGVQANGSDLGAAAVWVEDVSRYGELLITGAHRIQAFKEKHQSEARAGWVNGGVYYFKQPLLSRLMQLKGESLERDFLQKEIAQFNSWCLIHKDLFIDIGTPESLMNARNNVTALQKIMFSA